MDIKNVLSRIKPKDNSIKKEIDETVKTINSELKKNKIKAVAVIGGSFAKDTHLTDDYDCDVFVKFDYKYKDANLSDLLSSQVQIQYLHHQNQEYPLDLIKYYENL